MKTLQMFTLATLFAAAATASAAAEDQNIPTITVTAKRHVPAVERVAPRTPVEIVVTLPTDMPEAQIDYHLAPIATPPSK